MTKTITYGIIGCGMMGQEHLRNIALLPGAQVGAIYEPDPDMAALARRLAPGARFFTDLDAMLASDRIDCLLIASPNHHHLAQLEAIARARPRPVLVEKPLLTHESDLARLAAFRASYAAPVWVAMEYRYMPAIAEFLRAAPGATGGIRMLSLREHRFPFLPKVGDWNRFADQTGGTFVEKCCHFFDLMRLALGAEPVRIMASAGQDVNHLVPDETGPRADVLDNGYVIVDFEGGARALLDLCMFAEGSEYQEEISAVGPKGKIEARVPGPARFWPERLGPPPEGQLILSPRHPKGALRRAVPVPQDLLEAGDHNGATFYQHQRFLALVRGETGAPEVTIEDGLISVLMGRAAERSAREGRAVAMAEMLALHAQGAAQAEGLAAG
ncbi:Gfo/Idh/MocA family protein [Poseidonocella sedimentorum]|uniref:Predicted dehydrogenase n=1 Tax=Poseidonocella sedimentorum TaxID=871652 RepID=A0A1I6D2M1_9RHOB|nr:Gfo/Idh/MocA family oxidoreductase [Poseidonocella sedimentorum]SFQ99650.1 Predicted dehydrogenase [Poseidonocella sedimentorum]